MPSLSLSASLGSVPNGDLSVVGQPVAVTVGAGGVAADVQAMALAARWSSVGSAGGWSGVPPDCRGVRFCGAPRIEVSSRQFRSRLACATVLSCSAASGGSFFLPLIECGGLVGFWNLGQRDERGRCDDQHSNRGVEAGRAAFDDGQKEEQAHQQQQVARWQSPPAVKGLGEMAAASVAGWVNRRRIARQQRQRIAGRRPSSRRWS